MIIKAFPLSLAILSSCLVASLSNAQSLTTKPAPAIQPAAEPRFSTAGFYALPGTPRSVLCLNQGWRFFKGEAAGAQEPTFNDSSWEVVNLPHGLELLPEEASGGMNYRGPAWYRRPLELAPPSNASKGEGGGRVWLHFEAIMGKSKIWINGRLAAEHFGGYLPVIVDATDFLNPDGKNVLAVWADNSDDPTYPPGKPQNNLDFCYFGGIYRDCWLYTTGPVFVTDPNAAGQVAGGGVFVHYPEVSDARAEVVAKVHVASKEPRDTGTMPVKVDVRLVRENRVTARADADLMMPPGGDKTAELHLEVANPALWSPESPNLYDLEVRLIDKSGKVIDGLAQRIGIRNVEFRGKEGLFINGRPFEGKLIGGNRHQDFPYVGYALPNSGQWRDARKMRDAGMQVVRSHYPFDPAFVDACDELGILLISSMPGWQFYNPKPPFPQRMEDDLRQMIRRDRNHPCIFLWESVLNETDVEVEVGRRLHAITHEEFPYPGCYTSCDYHDRASAAYDVLYAHPLSLSKTGSAIRTDGYGYQSDPRCFFTREWGDQVSDWSSQNSDYRVPIRWGEQAQVTQAMRLFHRNDAFESLERQWATPRQHVGGALWTAIECQRGYHPEPFRGGVLDLFRQPKYSYWLLKSQCDPHKEPVLFVASELGPLSSPDIPIFTNCEEVRLNLFGNDRGVRKPEPGPVPHPPIVFPGAFNFREYCNQLRALKTNAVATVEGYVGGKKVIEKVIAPPQRKTQLRLSADTCNRPVVADGSDLVVVMAEIVDANGNVCHLSEETVRFEVTGEGELVGGADIGANPRPTRWGAAPALVRAGTKPGTIRIRATPLKESVHGVLPGELEIVTVAPRVAQLPGVTATTKSTRGTDSHQSSSAAEDELRRLRQELEALRNREVERAQDLEKKPADKAQ